MGYQYKLIVSNRNVYKEFEIQRDMEGVKLGTVSSCEFRLNPSAFFTNIVIGFQKKNEQWTMECSDEIYVSRGDMRKLLSTELSHGDILSVRYAVSGNEAFELRFMIDFEAKVPKFNHQITLKDCCQIIIGTKQNCDLYLKSQYCEGCEISLVRDKEEFYIQNINFKYGILYNGIEGKEGTKIYDNSFISIADVCFYYKKGILFFNGEQVETSEYKLNTIEDTFNELCYPQFNRNTRIKNILSQNTIDILNPPAQPEKPKTNIIISILPAIIMLAVTIVIRGFMSSSNSSFVIISVISMSMGITTSTVGIVSERKKYKKDCKNRIEQYTTYIGKKEEEISNMRQNELDILNDMYLDLESNIKLIEKFDKRLFERTPIDNDFLKVYLGKGKVKANREINYKKQEKYETEDELFEIPDEICKRYRYIENAPITVDFNSSNAIGVIGTDAHLDVMMKNIILDLSMRHYYSDIQIFAVLSQDRIEKFKWIRLIPHFQINDNIRNIVCDSQSKNNIFEFLYKELSRREEKGATYPYMIILVRNEMELKTHPIARFLNNATALNATFVFFEHAKELLPLFCNQIIELETDEKGKLTNCANEEEKMLFEYNTISDKIASKVGKRLAPVYCKEISLESTLRKSITLFEVLGIYNINDLDIYKRWETSQVYKTMAAPLGVNAKDEIVSLDLHEKKHGPHGLVAGTTGSGKSEILQAYILSAATLYHPYEIGFVIIDFKGGGMVNQFKDLPHLVGAITNIDGKQINRSLKSIKAELLKRQTLFAQAGVNHIDKYIRLYKEGKVSIALPHLIIIVDEFAELKAEQPEFMKELISAARIGRSLGVHLILATQKPAGQVNEQIWSNSNFKLCLKVQTKEDSNEVIKSPVAAEIREPGRAYFQVGNNEIFELFQSGFSGAPAEKEVDNMREFVIYQMDFSGRRKPVYRQKRNKGSKKANTQLEAIVEYINEYCRKKQIPKLSDICLPALDRVIMFPEEKNDITPEMSVAIGIYDNPDIQFQGKTYVNVSTENTLIIGSAQYGKTNLLQSIIRGLVQTYSPEEVNIYILDFGAMLLKNFENLKHVGGVVCASDDEKFRNLFKLLYSEIIVRKDKLMKAGVSSFISYKEAGYRDLPAIVVMVDNYIAVKELYLQDEDYLLTICRDGLAVGISVIIANSQTSGIGYKYLSNFAKRIVLYCNDSSEYSNVLEKCRMVPDNVVGRGLIEIEKETFEFQTFLSFEGKREIDRVNNMKAFTEKINSMYGKYSAKRIPEIPSILEKDYFMDLYGEESQDDYSVAIGLDYEAVRPVTINLLKNVVMGVVGKEKSGKSNLVGLIIEQLKKNMFSTPSKIYIVDDIEGQLSKYKNYGIVERYTIDANDFIEDVSEVYGILQERKKMVVEQGVHILGEQSLIMFVVQNREAIESLSKNANTIKIYKDIISQYKAYKICFLYSNIEDAAISFSGPEILKLMKENRRIFYFDNIQNSKICDVSSIVAKKYKKEIELGDMYYFKDSEIKKIKSIKYE